MIKITPPDGKMLRDIRNNMIYSEVICKDAKWFVVADSEDDPIMQELDGVTLGERVSDLEDAVVELAEIITEV